MRLNRNSLAGGRRGCKTKNLPWGEYGYFLESSAHFTMNQYKDTFKLQQQNSYVTVICFSYLGSKMKSALTNLLCVLIDVHRETIT